MKQIFTLVMLCFLQHTFSQCSGVFTSTRGVNAVGAPTCSDQTFSNLDPYESITFSVVAGDNYRVAINDINWNNESVSVFNNSGGAFIGGASGTTGASYTWTSGFTGTVRAVATRNCINTGSFGWFDGMQSATLTYRNTGIGDPSTFGSNEWRVHAYTGQDYNLGGGLIYNGYYAETSLTYDTRNRWVNGTNGTPSSASGYVGCPVGVDNHTVVSKRQGFPAGTYYIDVNNHDDEAKLFINGTQVFEHTPCCDFHCNVWSGTLGASSTVEFRHGEGGGGSHQGLNFKPYLINGVNEWNIYAFAGRNRDNLGAITYNGYYTRNTLSFNTVSDYGGSGSPAAASGYVGCDPSADNHTVVAMRQGFPCAVYSLNVINHDDEASLIVNGTTVWSANCCNDLGVKWTGVLDASSTVEMRYAEGGGGNGMGLTLTNVTTSLNGGVINYGGSTTACDGYNPPAFGSTSSASGGSSAALNNGSSTYQWQVNGGNISGATGTTYDPGALAAGTYAYRRVATDKCGATENSNTITITVDQPPTAPTAITSPATMSGITAICIGGSATLTRFGGSDGSGASYEWYAGGCGSGGSLGSLSSLTVSPTSTTTYYVRRVGTSSCTAATNCASITVIVNTPPTAPTTIFSTLGTTICNGETTTLSFSGGSDGSGATYLWYRNNCAGNFLGTGATITVSPIVTTTYFVRRLGNTACTSTTDCAVLTINVNQPPTAPTGITGTSTICSGGTTTLTATGGTEGSGSTYEWGTGSTVGSNIISGATSSSYTTLALTSNTTYWVRRVASTACTNTTGGVTQLVTVIQPTTSNAGANDTACLGATITLAANDPSPGTGAWTWSTAPSYENGTNATEFDAQVSFAAGGTYMGTWTTSIAPCTDATSIVNITVNSAATNVVLVPGTSVTATEVCVESPWTYYASPSNPDEYVFAIAKNGNTFTANVTITDVPGTAPIESLGGQPNVRGTWLISRYWNVTLASGSISAPVSIRFFIDDTERTEALADANAFAAANPWPSIPVAVTPLTWFKTNGAPFNPTGGLVNGDFTFTPTYLTSNADGTINGVKYFEFNNIISFSGGSGGFSVNDNGSPLPVELLNFEAQVINNKYVQLDWATATEINNDGFAVMRSTDGVNFERIAWVVGNGNSTETHNYSYDDYEVSKGITYYYQLMQVDFDGASESFNIVSAKLDGNRSFALGSLIPNPTKTQSTVSVDAFSLANEVMNITIYNHVGVKVLELKSNLVEGENNVVFNIADLSGGTYFINFEGSFGRETKKLIVIN